ncbi:MAG: RtcB family protein [Deltaproteobacteria bacterium]|nr:RtcB family protein [Deltaproteobacteria bacterium]
MQIKELGRHLFEIPRAGNMRVPARVYTHVSVPTLQAEAALEQLVGVAHLPGIRQYSLAMPDIHWGYGFPIGGVAAVDADDGAISPGGVGYDINCGVRLIATELRHAEVQDRVRDLTTAIFREVPAGVGASRAIPRLSDKELKKVLRDGAAWAVAEGYRIGSDDLDHCEEGGRLTHADPEALSEVALDRGRDQLGTLGSGNHFIELDVVDQIFDADTARAFGLFAGQLVVQIHSGSRGLGHQVCDDALTTLASNMGRFGADYARVPDPQLACAPVTSAEGRQYLGAMQAAANFAFANRQVMAALVVRALEQTLAVGPADLKARLVYDVCHNIAKREEHLIDGAPCQVLIHRKGATRAFAKGDRRLPPAYRHVGQPVLVPGDMGRYSFVLVGRSEAMTATFGSACHGAGRQLSRHQAIKQGRGRRIDRELAAQGITVMARGKHSLAEEMSDAYKDVAEVVQVLTEAGIVDRVARLRPVGVTKGSGALHLL